MEFFPPKDLTLSCSLVIVTLVWVWVYVFEIVYVCLSVCAHVCSGHRSTSGVTRTNTVVFQTGSLTDLDLTNEVRMAG